MEERRSKWLVGSVVLGVALLGAEVLQLSAIESRMVEQGRQLRVLGEATEKLVGQVKRIRSGGATEASAGDQQYANVKVLHPELPNFLKPKATHWPAGNANTSGTLLLGYPAGDPKGFNPLIENDTGISDRLRLYVESKLARRNSWTNPNEFYGDLAWRIEVADDYKEFTFYLRKGVKWHPITGVDLSDPRYAWLNKEHEVTANDLVFHLKMKLHPQVQNGAIKNYYKELESYEALDDHTFRMRWKKTQALNVAYSLFQMQPFPEFLFAYAEDGTRIPEATLGLTLNQHWYNNKGIPGSGPYQFSEYVPGSHIRLERNEDFYGELPASKTIRYAIYTDAAQTVLKLKSGELDFGALRAGQYREEILQYKDLPPTERPSNSPFLNGEIACDLVDRPVYYFVGWNADKPQFSDKLTRQAMTLAMNRTKFVENVMSGLGSLARGPFLESSGNLAPDVVPWPHDLKKAAELLKRAGWEDSDGDGLLDRAQQDGTRMPFQFSLMTYATSPEMASLANIFKEDLLSIGVKMTVQPAEWSLMIKRLNEKNFDAMTGGWGLEWEDDPYQVWHSSQANIPKGSNRVGFRNSEADRLIEELRLTLDLDKRTTMLRQFHRILHEEQPVTFLYVARSVLCHRNTLKGLVYSKERPVANLSPWWTSATPN